MTGHSKEQEFCFFIERQINVTAQIINGLCATWYGYQPIVPIGHGGSFNLPSAPIGLG
jgi:hypothetical protein